MQDQDTLVMVVQGWLVWAGTWAVGRYLPAGAAREKIRHWLPEISVVLAVGLVGAWQAVQGADVWSLQTLRSAVAAAGAAVLSHSVVREKIKVFAGGGKGAGTAGPSASNGGLIGCVWLLVLPVFLPVLLGGCGGVEISPALVPEVEISRQAGCVRVVVDQQVPAPEGWQISSQVVVQQDGCSGADGGADKGADQGGDGDDLPEDGQNH